MNSTLTPTHAPHPLPARPGLRWPLLLLVLLAVLVVAAVLAWRVFFPASPPSAPWPTTGWPASPPEAHGLDSAKLAEGLQAIQARGTFIHSLLLVRHGYVVLDAYFDPYDGSMLHDQASVTKSFMTTLIGIAADQGRLSLNDPVLAFFPGREVANRDERKERLTVAHLASMTAGIDCGAHGDLEMLLAMRASPDPTQFALDRPMVSEPGQRFFYCGLSMHLLSAILQQVTGQTALDFARANLFEPLGIQDWHWPADRLGVTHGWGDLALRPTDSAKLGLLFAHGGQWDGRQLVSAEWVAAATAVHAATGSDHGEDYGYGWWVSRPDSDVSLFRADGRNGQYVVVVPEWELIIATTGGGFSLDQIDEYLLASFVDFEKPLPANPAAVEQLADVVAGLVQPPQPVPVKPLPAIAAAISGQTYAFEANRIGLRMLSLEFDPATPSEASFDLDLEAEASPRSVGVGLDGVYRPARSGRPVLARGAWADEHTFVMEYNEGPGLSVYLMRLRFDGDTVQLELTDNTAGITLRAAGVQQQP
jgi:CubicO group peptidase (beta-lactamase class C family)